MHSCESGHYMEVNGHPNTQATLPWGGSPWYPFNSRLGGPQSHSGNFEEEMNLLNVLGFEPRIVQPVT